MNLLCFGLLVVQMRGLFVSRRKKGGSPGLTGDSLGDVLFLLCVSSDLHIVGRAPCGEQEAWPASSTASICLMGQNQVTGPPDL